MVIERADRFGLSQLHQLRGRVGRGGEASYCMLLYDEGLGLASRERLLILRDTEDGFAIADADFRLRGAGEALGTRQSGARSEEHTSELQSRQYLVCRLLLEKKININSILVRRIAPPADYLRITRKDPYKLLFLRYRVFQRVL